MKSLRDHIATNIPIYILVMVLTGLVAFYSLVFIPMNERQLNNHMDRLLANKAKTVLEKYNGYKAAIESTPRAYVINRAFSFSPDREQIYVYPASVHATKVYYGFDKAALKAKIKEAFNKEIPDNQVIIIHRNDLLSSALDKTLKPQTKGGTKFNNEQNLWQVTSGNYHFVLKPEGIEYFNTDKNAVEHPYLWLYVRGFMENIKETDFFDDLFLVATDTLAKEKRQVQEGQPEPGAVLDRSALGLVRFDLPDSIRKTGTGFFFKRISGQTYAVFAKEIKLRRNLSVYLVGLMEKSRLVSKAREVPAWFVVFSSLIALLLIFLMPIIKLFSINKSERLLARDARLTVFSMILTVSLVTVLLAGSYLFWGLEKQKAEQELEALVHRMDTLASYQVKAAVSALSDEKIFDNDSARWWLQAHGVSHYNEAIRVSLKSADAAIGRVTQAYGENRVNYLTDLFPIKLGSREYVRKPRAAFDNQLEADYFLQAFNSYSTGRAEVGISRLHASDSALFVITSRLPAFINATIPSPYHFVVTDKTGEVMFNSRWKELQIENFISECNNNVTLDNHIRHDVTGKADFTYLGSECSGYGKPILKDWYLLVYREVSTTKNLAAEVFGLCLLTLAMVTILIGLIHLCLLADRKKSSLLLTRNFIYHWLNPFSAQPQQWIRLAAFSLLLFAAEMVWSYFSFSIVSAIPFVFLCVTLFYLVVYGSLNETAKAAGRWSLAMKFLVALLLALVLGLAWVTWVDDQWETLAVAALTGLTVWLFFRLVPQAWWDRWESVNRYLSYRLFLLAALLVLAIGPSLLFLSSHYHYTSLSINYHYLMDDLLKLQVQDSNDVEALRGDDYIGHELRVKKPVKEVADSSFYAFVQDLQPQTPSLAGINLGHLPNSSGFVSLHNEDSAMMKSPASVLLPNREMLTGRLLHNMMWVNNSLAYLILLLAAVALAGLWWALALLPRKIFFAPDLIVWEGLKAPKTTDFFDFEFDQSEDDKHILHSFNVLDKAELIAYKDDEERKKDSQNDPDAFRDRVILKLQDKAEDLYEMAWRKCSEEEKYFLYDLASDGIASQVDQVLISKLAEKRLIRLRPYLRPVNVSFANYVLKSMTSEDIDKWKEKESSEGNWRNLKWILLIVIATVFIFLSVAEESFLGRVTAILASIGLVVPQLINIVTSVGGIFKKG